MKKYWKLSSIILASSMLFTTAAVSLASLSRVNVQSTPDILPTLEIADTRATTTDLDKLTIGESASSSRLAIITYGYSVSDHLYAWGNNTNGQLGLGDKVNRLTPTLVTINLGVDTRIKISKVATGGDFSVIAAETITVTAGITTRKYNVWTAGSNAYGQLGNGDKAVTESLNFIKIWESTNEVTALAAGGSHAMFVAGGQLYTWGHGKFGQNGNGKTDDILKPTILSYFVQNGIKQISCGLDYSMVSYSKPTDLIGLYTWGKNEVLQATGVAGTGAAILTPTLMPNSLYKGEIVNFFSIFESTYLGTHDSTDNTNHFYGWGSNLGNQLGMPGYTVNKPVTEIVLPFTTGVKKALISNASAFLISNDGELYQSGALRPDNPQPPEFAKFGTITGYDRAVGGQSLLLIANDKMYAYKTNEDYGAIGNGTTKDYREITLVDTFSAPSIVQKSSINTIGMKTAEAINDFYPKSGFNETAFKKYIDTSKFPSDAVYTMTTPPDDERSNIGTIHLEFNVDKYFNEDGAKIIAEKSFKGYIDGFEYYAHPNSTVTTKTTIDSKKYFSQNIISKLLPAGDKNPDLNVLNDLFDLVNFGADNVFTIEDAKVNGSTFTAKLTATKAYKDQILGMQTFDLTVPGLVNTPDSIIVKKTPWPTDVNLNNIQGLLGDGKSKENVAVLGRLIDLTYFPLDTAYIITVKSNPLVSKKYEANLRVNRYYLDGVYTSAYRDYDLLFENLKEQPDSHIIYLTKPEYINRNNIKNLLGNGSTKENVTVLGSLIDLSYFPGTSEFIIDLKSDPLVSGIYQAELIATQNFVNGSVSNEKKSYTLLFNSLASHPDSKIVMQPNIPAYINLHNIQGLLGDGKSADNMNVLKTLIDLSTFRNDSTYELKNIGNPINDGKYSATLVATNYYLEGNVITAQGDFNFTVDGLKPCPDSYLVTYNPPLSEWDNIKDNLKIGIVDDTTVLGTLIDLSKYPSDTVYTIKSIDNIDEENKTFDFTFIPSKKFEGGFEKNIDNGSDPLVASIKFMDPVVNNATANDTGLIIGLCIGGALLLIIIGLVIWYYMKKHPHKLEVYDK